MLDAEPSRMIETLDYQRPNHDTAVRRLSVPAIVGLPPGICSPFLAFLVAAVTSDESGFVLLIAMTLFTTAALICSLKGMRMTNPKTSSIRGHGIAVTGVMINTMLLGLTVAVWLMIAQNRLLGF